jgi:hypothetical protein
LLQRALAEVSMRAFGEELKQAHEEREALITELRYAMTHIGEVLGDTKASYLSKWNRFENLVQDRTLGSQFQAGRILGEVLLDVVSLIGGGAAAIKAASKIPRLAKLAKLKIPAKAPSYSSSGSGAAAARAPRATPAQMRSPEPQSSVIEAKPAPGGAAAVRAGQAGERAVRAATDIGPKVRIQVSGRTRVPDGLTETVLSEVKNAKSVSYTRQLRDYEIFAAQTGREFQLYVRPDTRLSQPLMQAVREGRIVLRFIP